MHKYIWHLSGERWERVMDKIDDFSKSFKSIHQRFLNKQKLGYKSSRKSNNKTS